MEMRFGADGIEKAAIFAQKAVEKAAIFAQMAVEKAATLIRWVLGFSFVVGENRRIRRRKRKEGRDSCSLSPFASLDGRRACCCSTKPSFA